MYPELSFREYETSEFICKYLDSNNIDYVSNIAGTGIIAWVDGLRGKGKVVALRAELDALPINEKFMEQYYWFERAARQNSLFSQHILAFSLLSPHWLEYFMLAGTDEEKERAALTLALKVSDAHYREQGIEYLEMLISEGNSDAVLKTAVDYAKTLI